MKRTSQFIFTFLVWIITTNTNQLNAQAPIITSFFPSKGYVGSLVTINGSNLNNALSVTIGNVNAITISSSSTQLVAMVMLGAVTGNVTVTNGSGTFSTSNSFTVSASVPPNKQSGDKLYGLNTENILSPLEQGYSVAMSADGNTAAVGADKDSNQLGAVRIFIRNNNVWTQQGDKLTGSGAIGSSFQGASLALSADGNTLIEGGVGDNGFTGAAWIFIRDKNSVWLQQGNKLVGSNSIIIGTTTPEQGYAVSISADGNTAIIGGRRDNNYIGAAWIFTRNNNVWTEQQKIVPTGYISTAYHQGNLIYLGVDMGTSVALSADGNTALIGGPVDNNDTGAVWVFTLSNNVWMQQSKLTGAGGNRSFLGGIQQGTSCAINADGNTAIIGAPFDLDSATANNTDNYYNGAVWIFTRTNNIWSQQGNKLFAAGAGLSAEQGWSVSLSADGNTAIAGAPGDSTYTGGAWIYTRSNNIWAQRSNRLLGSSFIGAPEEGYSSAISADGNTAIIGGPQDYYHVQGAAWVFADSNAVVLAADLDNFSAYIFNKGIQTTWTGFDETNISNYVVERSDDGYHFTAVGNIVPKSNTSLKNNYAWFDASPLKGNNFYRIKAISKDGSVQYSSTMKINFGNNTKGNIQVYPNPANNKIIHLQLNNIVQGDYNISVYNINGETTYSQGFQYTVSTTSLSINLKNAAAGVYKIEMKNNSNSYYTTVVLR